VTEALHALFWFFPSDATVWCHVDKVPGLVPYQNFQSCRTEVIMSFLSGILWSKLEEASGCPD